MGMLKSGLGALLIGLLVFGSDSAPATPPPSSCAMTVCGSCCCAGRCACPVKGGSCVACVREKADLAVVTGSPAAKPRVNMPLYLLPESKPADGNPLFVRTIRGLDSSPPFGGGSSQALLRLWLI